jgi:hypothetical protein
MPLSRFHWAALAAAAVILLVAGCAAPEPRPEGVGRGISFSVTALYPKSFEITAFGSRLRDAEELKAAWKKKAQMLANGHGFKISSPPVAHNNESDYGGSPLLSRSVTGTITLID